MHFPFHFCQNQILVIWFWWMGGNELYVWEREREWKKAVLRPIVKACLLIWERARLQMVHERMQNLESRKRDVIIALRRRFVNWTWLFSSPLSRDSFSRFAFTVFEHAKQAKAWKWHWQRANEQICIIDTPARYAGEIEALASNQYVKGDSVMTWEKALELFCLNANDAVARAEMEICSSH